MSVDEEGLTAGLSQAALLRASYAGAGGRWSSLDEESEESWSSAGGRTGDGPGGPGGCVSPWEVGHVVGEVEGSDGAHMERRGPGLVADRLVKESEGAQQERREPRVGDVESWDGRTGEPRRSIGAGSSSTEDPSGLARGCSDLGSWWGRAMVGFRMRPKN